MLMKKRKEEEEEFEQQLDHHVLAEMDLFTNDTGTSQLGFDFGIYNPHPCVSMMMNQQMQMTMQMQRKMMLQAKLLSEEQRKLEERRKFDDLQFSINNLQKMIMLKEGTELNNNKIQKGSVKARVGPKNSLMEEELPSMAIQKEYSLKDKRKPLNNKNQRPKKVRYQNSKLPEELVLTNLTEQGPKPAPKRICWSDKDDGIEDRVVVDIPSDEEY